MVKPGAWGVEGGPTDPPANLGHARSGSARGLLELELAGVRGALVTSLSFGAQFLRAGVVRQVPCQNF